MNATTENVEFTIDYFNSQVCEFRQLFGQKDFWNKPEEHRELAVKALSYVYFNTKTTTPEDEVYLKSTFKNTMDEYNHRGTMIFMLNLKKIGA